MKKQIIFSLLSKEKNLKQTLNKRAIFSLLKNYIIIVKHRFLSLTFANKLY